MTVRDGKVITPPVTASILESVTRGRLIEFIAEDLGIPVEVRDFTRVEFYAADEACGLGNETDDTARCQLEDPPTHFKMEVTV